MEINLLPIMTFLAQLPSTTSGEAQICFGCLTEPPRYSQMNFTLLKERLIDAGLQLPEPAKNCRDTHATNPATFSHVPIVKCLASHTCLKLRGTFQGEPFVYRNCWDSAWATPRKFDAGLQYSCLNDKELTFMTVDEDTHKSLCFCARDLCNGADDVLFKTFPLLITALVLIART